MDVHTLLRTWPKGMDPAALSQLKTWLLQQWPVLGQRPMTPADICLQVLPQHNNMREVLVSYASGGMPIVKYTVSGSTVQRFVKTDGTWKLCDTDMSIQMEDRQAKSRWPWTWWS